MSTTPCESASSASATLGGIMRACSADLAGVSLVGVVDDQPAVPRRSPPPTTPPVIADWRTLIGRVDAVTIAVPTEAHASVALPLHRPPAFTSWSRSR